MIVGTDDEGSGELDPRGLDMAERKKRTEDQPEGVAPDLSLDETLAALGHDRAWPSAQGESFAGSHRAVLLGALMAKLMNTTLWTKLAKDPESFDSELKKVFKGFRFYMRA
jgi:hypothetical protein